jgi:hypothetical protein
MREDSDSGQLRFDLANSPAKSTSATPLSYRDALIMQIARDMAVLREDPVYHAPSREFYEGRIAAYREEARRQTQP